MTVKTLIVGDKFIPAQAYLDAFDQQSAQNELDLQTVEWSGEKAAQHALQQVIEARGANAVKAPPPRC